MRYHRHVMEQHIGRLLFDEEHVHHRNHIRTDNRIENLQILSSSEHGKLHRNLQEITDEQRQKMSDSAVMVSMIPGESERRSLRASAQHATKNFGAHTWSDEARQSVSEKNRIYPDDLVRQIRATSKIWLGTYEELGLFFGVSTSWARNVSLGKRRPNV